MKKNPRWPRVHDDNHAKKRLPFFFSGGFGVKEPRHAETVLAKKRYTVVTLS